jgi:hypothetical protein
MREHNMAFCNVTQVEEGNKTVLTKVAGAIHGISPLL